MGMQCKCVIPKKFLCRYKLSLGANLYGILMIIVMIACIIAAIIDMLGYQSCENNSYSVKRSAYAFSVIIILYSIIMIIVHSWFLWAVKKNKSSVILVWVVLTGLWLVQTTVLTIVLLCLYTTETTFTVWILCVVFGIIAFIICLYGVLIGYGLWIEQKNVAQAAANPS